MTVVWTQNYRIHINNEILKEIKDIIGQTLNYLEQIIMLCDLGYQSKLFLGN